MQNENTRTTDELCATINELIQNNNHQAEFTPVDINNECIGYD